jgi:hypothetical protein
MKSNVSATLSRSRAESRDVLGPQGRSPYQPTTSVRVVEGDESTGVRLFPNWKSRTRSPPRLHHLNVGPRTNFQPLEQIEYQVVHCAPGARHMSHSIFDC